MMRVLLLITQGDIGGAQMSVFFLASYLKKHGVEVTVGLGPEGDFLKKKLQDASIHTHTFTHLRRTHHPLTNLRCIREIKKFLTQHPQDVVHCNSSNTLFGAIAAKRTPTPPRTIFTHRGLSLIDPLYTPSLLKRTLNIFFLKMLLRWVDVQVFVSKKNQEEAHRVGIHEKQEVVIYNGLASEAHIFQSREEARAALSTRVGIDLTKRFVVGSIGRLAYQKNYDFLIEQIHKLAQSIPEIACIVIGDGPEQEKLRGLVKKHQIHTNIFFVGAIPEGAQYMRAFDLFVLPSRYEGLSITLIEALYAGLPVVASDVGGNREVVESAGVIYPVDDALAFQKVLADLFRDEKRRTVLSQHALERAPLFGIEKTGEAYLSVYNPT